MLDRRELLLGTVGGLLGSLALPGRAHARQAGVTSLTRRLSLVTAGVTNVLAFAGDDGLVVVDGGDPAHAEALVASLRTLSPNGRIATLFNTHWHPEHTGANEALGRAGTSIVAHENTRLWMATPTWIPAEDRYRQPRPETARPTETFYDVGSKAVGDERVDYGYLTEAHTSGDIYVYFRDANVIAVGDVASPARDPELDYFTGAWIGGRVDALARLVDLTDDDTRVVPGFGPVMRRAELVAERDVMAEIYTRTVDRVREGDSADDMLEAGVLDGLGRTWADPRSFLYALHKGLWAHHNKLSANVV